MADNMKRPEITETRKIQVSGNSTYLITLPKKWVEKVRLKSSDSIALVPLSNGTLLINPINLIDTKLNRLDDGQLIKAIGLSNQDFEVIWRKFVGAYLVGYNLINFRSNKTLSKSDRMMIKKISNSVMGTEIVDETGNSVTVRDLLGKGGFSIVQGVQRMHIIARSMLQDAVLTIKSRDEDLMEDVHARDEEIDKFNWMVGKQYNFISRDVYFADKMGITPQEALGYLLVARAIERIADHGTKIAHNSKSSENGIKLSGEIDDLSSSVVRLFDDSMSGFFQSDFKYSDGLIKEARDIRDRISELNKRVHKLKSDPSTTVSLAYILDSLERVRSYSVDISEISINHLYVTELQRKNIESLKALEGDD
jgi:phosphate uptake regulator